MQWKLSLEGELKNVSLRINVYLRGGGMICASALQQPMRQQLCDVLLLRHIGSVHLLRQESDGFYWISTTWESLTV